MTNLIVSRNDHDTIRSIDTNSLTPYQPIKLTEACLMKSIILVNRQYKKVPKGTDHATELMRISL